MCRGGGVVVREMEKVKFFVALVSLPSRLRSGTGNNFEVAAGLENK